MVSTTLKTDSLISRLGLCQATLAAEPYVPTATCTGLSLHVVQWLPLLFILATLMSAVGNHVPVSLLCVLSGWNISSGRHPFYNWIFLYLLLSFVSCLHGLSRSPLRGTCNFPCILFVSYFCSLWMRSSQPRGFCVFVWSAEHSLHWMLKTVPPPPCEAHSRTVFLFVQMWETGWCAPPCSWCSGVLVTHTAGGAELWCSPALSRDFFFFQGKFKTTSVVCICLK